MSDDLIKREDAIKAIEDKVNGSDNRLWLKEIISELPSADRPKVNAELRADFLKRQYESALEEIKRLKADRPQEWIPCRERLPKKEEATYLICTETGYMCSCRWINDMYGLGATEWSKWGWHIMDKPQYAKVVAWMPLKPWKGADDEYDK